MGVVPTTLAMRFFSWASRGFTRCGTPSPTRMTPGRPMTRCTASSWAVPVTAGVIRHLPRRLFCSDQAAAPGVPSACLYTEVCTRREKTIIASMPPRIRPSGRVIHQASPTNRPRPTSTAAVPSSASSIHGINHLSDLRWSLNASQICLRRSFFSTFCAALSAFFSSLEIFPDSAGLAMTPRIRRPTSRETPPGSGRSAAEPRSAADRCAAVPGLRTLAVQRAGPVGRADQRPGHHTGEADLLGLLAELDELDRFDPPVDRMVAWGRPQVLGDGDQVTPGG